MSRFSLLLAITLLGITSSRAGASARVENLRCEYARDPMGIDTPRPRLSWTIDSSARGVVQTAYQMQVESSGRLVWDSGKVASEQSVGVEYDGAALTSGSEYRWRVRVWDRAAAATNWSEWSKWEMGLLNPGDWTAKWIIPAPREDAGGAEHQAEGGH